MGHRTGDVSEFGSYLLERVAERGYRSPTAFARAAGLEPSIVHRWIAGKVVPTPETLRRAAPALGVSFPELLAVALGVSDDSGSDMPEPTAGDGGRDVVTNSDGGFHVWQAKPGPPPELLWQMGLAPAPEPAPGEFTLAEILRLIHRDDFVLGVLLSRAGLGQTQMRRLVMAVRRRREEQNVELLREVADLIRDAGGVAPDPVWPPVWLVGETPSG